MADDIDIEEHDVLDNPKIKDIFPDLSRIKTEAPDLEEEEQQLDYDYYPEEDVTQHNADYAEETVEVEYTQQNKIILGSKPQQPTLAYGIHIQSVHESALVFGRNQHDVTEIEPYCNVEQPHSSKLILGSKPQTEERIPENATVMLEDWGPRLETSPCYCKECQILFPTRNVLDAHNMSSHSFLVALDVEQSSPGASSTNDSDDKRFCNHCNKTFPNNTALIKHLYMIVTSDKFDCNLCDRVFATKVDLAVHFQSHSKIDDSNEESDKETETDYFRCSICSVYIRYQNLYETHMKKMHSENNFDMIKVKFDGKCKFCPRVNTVNKHYNAHIKNNHASLYFKNCATLTVNKYLCIKCYDVLPSYNAARTHRAKRHPDSKNLNLFKVVQAVVRPNGPSKQTSVSVKKTLVPVQRPVQKPAKFSHLIPKSILFKCDKCQIHFTSCWSAIAHSKTCMKFKGDWKCQQCRRVFKSTDSFVHQYQHQVSERFQIITCHENLYGKVLHQCPDCDLYFHEKEFKRHCIDGCRVSNAVRCGYCCASMHHLSIDRHYNWHRILEFGQQDVVLIPYEKIVKNNEEPVEKTVNDEKESKTESDSFKTKIYYCSTCKCCMHNTKNTQMHLDKICTKLQKCICKTCGLMFSAKGHKTFHQNHEGLQISDLKFIRIQDKKVISPPFPAYPKCKQCNTHFCRKISIRACTHSDFKTCKYCKWKFSDLALKVHLPLHEYNKNVLPKKVPKPEMPVLLQKYEMIANTWNILYLCQFCDVVCDSYDKMIDHCQKHYNKMESYDVTIKNCQVCDLKFDGACFDKHRRIHAESRTIKKDSFQIFTYDFTTLFSDDWLNLFGALPKLQIDHITSRSIYNYTRGLKMAIAQQGTQEFTLYKCAKCLKYIDPSKTFDHFIRKCSRDDRSFFCSVCYLPFASLLAKDQHMVQHKHSKEKPFRIVLFNNPVDELFNKAMCSEQMMDINPTPVNVAKKRKYSEISKARKIYHYYKCVKCKCCLKMQSNTKKHECSFEKQRKECKICGIFVASRYSGKHAKFHEIVPNVTKANIKITPFVPKTDAEDVKDQPDTDFVKQETESVKQETEYVEQETECVQQETDESFTTIHKCQCGLHFISEKSILKHSVSCTPYLNSSEGNCSKCGLLFDTNELVKHLCKHHSIERHFRYVLKEQDDDDNYVEQNTRKHRIFKCGKCNVHFLSSKNIRYHIRINHKLKNSLTCDECGLTFSFQSIQKHIKMHHSKLKCELKDFLFVVPNEKDGGKMETSYCHSSLSSYSNALHYCNHCSKHFISRRSYQEHALKIKQFPAVTPGKQCSHCGLVFSTKCLSRHVLIHHDGLKLTRKDFVILGKNVRTAQKSAAPHDEAIVSEEDDNVNNIPDDDKTLHKCIQCDLHFMKVRTYQWHIHENHAVKRKGNCSICGLGFTNVSLIKHTNLHHTKLNLKLDDLNILNYSGHERVYNEGSEKGNVDEKVTVIKDLNTAVKSKKSRPKIKLYRCDVCGTHYVNKTSLHSHLYRNFHNVAKTTCDKCGLCFNIRSLDKHLLVHHKNVKRGREDFVIIHRKSRKNVGEKVSKSTNEERTALSSRIVFEDSCSSGEDNDLDTNSIGASQSLDLAFNNTGLEENASQVSQTEEQSICLDEDENTNEGSQQNSINSSRLSTTSYLNTVYDNTMFKCENCGLHFFKENTLDVHRCQETENSTKRLNCNECGLLFTAAGIARHKVIHHEKQTLNKEDFEVISFYKRGKFFANNCLYKCRDCDIYFYRKYHWESHMTKEGKHSVKLPKIECGVCGLSFTSMSIAKHKEMHHDTMKLNIDDYMIVTQTVNEYKTLRGLETDSVHDTATVDDTKLDDDDLESNASDINSIDEKKIYKCLTCQIHFIKLKTLTRHSKNCKRNSNIIVNKINCENCGLKFSPQSLIKHRNMHHTKLQLSLKDFHITDINGTEITDSILDKKSVTSRSKTYKRVTKSVRTSSKRKSKVNSDEILDKTIFKCDMCDVHFIKQNSLVKHIVTCDGSMRVGECTECHLKFSRVSLFKHINIHHEIMNLKRHDMKIVSNSHDTDNDSVISQSTAQSHEIRDTNDDSQTAQSDINTEQEDCGSQSNDGEKIETQKEMDSLDEFEVSQSTTHNNSNDNELMDKTDAKTEIKLYKCADCNVYFMTQATCYKHVQKHIPLDSKEYIECKLCGFQFKIITLHRHIIGHHSEEFKLENVLVEEYRSNSSATDSYYAIDKVQSRLVSTTTETNKDISVIKDENSKNLNENNDKTNEIIKPSEDNVAIQVVSSCDNVIDGDKTTANSDAEIIVVEVKVEIP